MLRNFKDNIARKGLIGDLKIKGQACNRDKSAKYIIKHASTLSLSWSSFLHSQKAFRPEQQSNNSLY